MNEYNLLIASVGGQGGLTLSETLAVAAVNAGFSVRTGETLGMAQRGGSVQSFVRIGKDVRSPLFPQGTADALLALEGLEAARSAPYVKKGALVLVDPAVRQTITTLTKKEKYPPLGEILSALRERSSNLYVVRAQEEAASMGSPKSANVYMLGAFCSLSNLLPTSAVEKAIESVLGRKAKPAIDVFNRGLARGPSLARYP
ncbi:MAG TPA: indolepyruvate oxidoreductase subunit beta [Conexivisphaerales archaeon]|nr:indolepyruvate oxidoreductase subunit beta [Conexivisphaerales archaeon]